MLQEETISGLILAAGLSTRMQTFKPLMPLWGRTLIENTVDSMFAGGVKAIVVVTGYRGDELESVLSARYGAHVISVRNPEYATTDMLHSIQIGCAALPECDAFFLLPGDMPVVKQSTFEKLRAARSHTKAIVFPTLDGHRKHPPLVDTGLIPDILAFRQDGGLRRLWAKYTAIIREVPVDDTGVWVDLDTQDDYQNCKNKYHQ